jgi:hypothetical protein
MDQIIDKDMARGLQDDAARAHGEVGWVISQDPPAHPGKALMARLVSTIPTPYVLLADTLAELHVMLPAGALDDMEQEADVAVEAIQFGDPSPLWSVGTWPARQQAGDDRCSCRFRFGEGVQALVVASLEEGLHRLALSVEAGADLGGDAPVTAGLSIPF